MGAGMTLQALALVHTLLNAGQAARVLIVVPSSLVQNWWPSSGALAPAYGWRRPFRVASALPVGFAGPQSPDASVVRTR